MNIKKLIVSQHLCRGVWIFFAAVVSAAFIVSADITCKGGEGVVETGKVFGVPQRVAETSPRIMATCLEENRLYAGGGPDFYVLDVAEPIKPKLLGIFIAICTVGIILVGYFFNIIQNYII